MKGKYKIGSIPAIGSAGLLVCVISWPIALTKNVDMWVPILLSSIGGCVFLCAVALGLKAFISYSKSKRFMVVGEMDLEPSKVESIEHNLNKSVDFVSSYANKCTLHDYEQIKSKKLAKLFKKTFSFSEKDSKGGEEKCHLFKILSSIEDIYFDNLMKKDDKKILVLKSTVVAAILEMSLLGKEYKAGNFELRRSISLEEHKRCIEDCKFGILEMLSVFQRIGRHFLDSKESPKVGKNIESYCSDFFYIAQLVASNIGNCLDVSGMGQNKSDKEIVNACNQIRALANRFEQDKENSNYNIRVASQTVLGLASDLNKKRFMAQYTDSCRSHGFKNGLTSVLRFLIFFREFFEPLFSNGVDSRYSFCVSGFLSAYSPPIEEKNGYGFDYLKLVQDKMFTFEEFFSPNNCVLFRDEKVRFLKFVTIIFALGCKVLVLDREKIESSPHATRIKNNGYFIIKEMIICISRLVEIVHLELSGLNSSEILRDRSDFINIVHHIVSKVNNAIPKEGEGWKEVSSQCQVVTSYIDNFYEEFPSLDDNECNKERGEELLAGISADLYQELSFEKYLPDSTLNKVVSSKECISAPSQEDEEELISISSPSEEINGALIIDFSLPNEGITP